MAKATLVPIARTGPYIVLSDVCSIHVSSMSVREEARLSMAPPSSSQFHQQQSNYNYFLIHLYSSSSTGYFYILVAFNKQSKRK
ncbi:unnamed protein product [Rotaria magnacalcarata]|uniref:Uncharacterized protein n=1 Tax=Rotaria magnacalcarata TaxID=392030 RepID=A0A820CLD2_9BILA|nr:unnamed protein product [Rotaria magnacalcarata]CAF4828142.1 unnamed protein product [Rotaria magnacalcarata]